MPGIYDWRDVEARMTGGGPTALLRPVREDALRGWIISTSVNKAGLGDNDAALVEAAA
jgi:hypothetical protein